MKPEDWQRAGFVEKNGALERTNGTANIRPAKRAEGRTDILTDDTGKVAVVEPDTCDGALGKEGLQGGIGQQFLVRVISIRKHLLDQDNLCEKYVCDLLRYSGVIPGDSPATTRIEVCQQKADKGAAEEIKIEVYRL